jgi:holin-like protein
MLQRPSAILPAALQALALVGLWWLCDWAARRTHLPVPGGVLGMGLLILLLAFRLLPLAWVKRGADLLLKEMLLFFIPAVVAVVQYPALVLRKGISLFLVILAGTSLVMVCTALVMESAVRAQRRLRVARRRRR